MGVHPEVTVLHLLRREFKVIAAILQGVAIAVVHRPFQEVVRLTLQVVVLVVCEAVVDHQAPGVLPGVLQEVVVEVVGK